MEGERERAVARASGESHHELNGDRVNCDRTSAETQRAVCVERGGEMRGHVAVFDDDSLACAFAEHTDLLFRVALAHHLARHLCGRAARTRVQTKEDRINHFVQRVVNLEVREMTNAARGHVFKCAA